MHLKYKIAQVAIQFILDIQIKNSEPSSTTKSQNTHFCWISWAKHQEMFTFKKINNNHIEEGISTDSTFDANRHLKVPEHMLCSFKVRGYICEAKTNKTKQNSRRHHR